MTLDARGASCHPCKANELESVNERGQDTAVRPPKKTKRYEMQKFRVVRLQIVVRNRADSGHRQTAKRICRTACPLLPLPTGRTNWNTTAPATSSPHWTIWCGLCETTLCCNASPLTSTGTAWTLVAGCLGHR